VQQGPPLAPQVGQREQVARQLEPPPGPPVLEKEKAAMVSNMERPRGTLERKEFRERNLDLPKE
jgi:hypothetical protein